MTKTKIAISLDTDILSLLDSKVDGSIIRSRSQAVELYLKKGLEDEQVTDGVILLKGSHQKHSIVPIRGKSLIQHQIDFLQRNGIRKVYILTQTTKNLGTVLNEIAGSKADVKVIEKEVKNNTSALMELRENVQAGNFVVLSGDTYYDFDLANMIRKHMASDLLATMGLMTSDSPTKYGNAVVSGDLIVDFAEKPAKATSPVVNAGVYVFKPEIFALLDNPAVRMEVSLFPKLARIKQLLGHFAYGEYKHFAD